MLCVQVSLLLSEVYSVGSGFSPSYLGWVRRELPGKAQARCELRRHGYESVIISAGTNSPSREEEEEKEEEKEEDKKDRDGGFCVENILPEGFL